MYGREWTGSEKLQYPSALLSDMTPGINLKECWVDPQSWCERDGKEKGLLLPNIKISNRSIDWHPVIRINGQQRLWNKSNKRLMNAKPAALHQGGWGVSSWNSTGRSARRSWTLGFLSSLGKPLLRERKKSFDNCQREWTSAGWMNLHVARSRSAHTVQTISTNAYCTKLKDLLSSAVLRAAHSLPLTCRNSFPLLRKQHISEHLPCSSWVLNT